MLFSPDVLGSAHARLTGKPRRAMRPLILALFPAAMLLSVMSANVFAAEQEEEKQERTNFLLIMADDQGYADIGYMDPRIKTPALEDMAANGLRFTRFYAAAPVCSPTRGSVLTGRHPNRFGCFSWGHTLRPQEITIAEELQRAGYVTGHFGKWHLGPVVAGEPASPGESGFDVWTSAPNFYGNDPWLSRNGNAVHLQGESSAATAREALRFIDKAVRNDKPFLAVVWFGNPHLPHNAAEELLELYPKDLPKNMRNYYAEITGVDRAVGMLRERLRELGIAENTLVWYTSDNGGREPEANNGPLRGDKATLWEGGIRVPAIIEWPGHIEGGRITDIPAGTVDIFPTLLDIAGVKPSDPDRPLDGISLVPLLKGKMESRPKPLGFWKYPAKGRPTPSKKIVKALAEDQQHGRPPTVYCSVLNPADQPYPEADELPGRAAWIDGDWKLIRNGPSDYALYNLAKDVGEQHNVIETHPERAARMKKALVRWMRSVVHSLRGGDYGQRE